MNDTEEPTMKDLTSNERDLALKTIASRRNMTIKSDSQVEREVIAEIVAARPK